MPEPQLVAVHFGAHVLPRQTSPFWHCASPWHCGAAPPLGEKSGAKQRSPPLQSPSTLQLRAPFGRSLPIGSGGALFGGRKIFLL